MPGFQPIIDVFARSIHRKPDLILSIRISIKLLVHNAILDFHVSRLAKLVPKKIYLERILLQNKMGRELQKKKNRSSNPKVRQKPKSKKKMNLKTNPIIAANW